MSENQLREAYTLMKQGDKKGAARLVQDVLREDKSNTNAWWLFSHLLEDEDKIVKSLEKILALNPDHAGARKKLASMRPEYAHLAPTTEEPKAKAKTEQQSAAYWSKLDNEHKNREKAYTKHVIKKTMFSVFGIRILLFLILAPFMAAYAVWFNLQNQASFYDKNGDTPLTVAAVYLDALYREDFDTLYAMACPQYHPQIDEMVADASGIDSAQITVDLSKTVFSIYYQNGNQAFVEVDGVTLVDYGTGNLVTIDWTADALAENIDVFGEHFYRTDEVWQICIERRVPNLDYTGD
jgi:hypothetical protein